MGIEFMSDWVEHPWLRMSHGEHTGVCWCCIVIQFKVKCPSTPFPTGNVYGSASKLGPVEFLLDISFGLTYFADSDTIHVPPTLKLTVVYKKSAPLMCILNIFKNSIYISLKHCFVFISMFLLVTKRRCIVGITQFTHIMCSHQLCV